jgi:nucleotide-binding universal stress UspA family protein
MFRHILIPTDGSRLAAKGIKAGVKLAKALGARVTGVYVIPPHEPAMYGEGALYVAAPSAKQYKKRAEAAAKKALAAIAIEAQAEGIACGTQFVTAGRPSEGILRVAHSRKCDAIAMASHGRGGVASLLLGSETQRVLAQSKIPVLVSR